MRALFIVSRLVRNAGCVLVVPLAAAAALGQSQDYAQIEGSYSGTVSYTATVDMGWGVKKSQSGTADISDLEISQTDDTVLCQTTVDDVDYTWTGKLKGNKISVFGPSPRFSLSYSAISLSNGSSYGGGPVKDGMISLHLIGTGDGSVLGLGGDVSLDAYIVLYGPAIPAPDTTPPTIKIGSPAPNKRVTSSVLTARGTAADDQALAQVFCQLNGGDWVSATGARSWKAEFTPSAGTNTLSAYSVDASGNCSITNTVSFFQVVNSPLTLQTNGGGRIIRYFSGNTLHLYDPYTVKAVAKSPKWMFAGWTGDVSSPSLTLNFTMQPNMTLIANFTTNAFPSRQGNYNGVFFESSPRPESSGAFTLSLGSDGTFSGKISQGGGAYPFAGQLDAEGRATTVIKRKGNNPLNAEWTLDLANVTDTINVTVQSGAWSVSAIGDRACFNSRTNPAPTAGRYAVAIPGGNAPALVPEGDGFGIVVVDSAGRVTFTGALADGTSVSQGTTISKYGQLPLYIPIYGGKGMLLSWVSLTNTPPGSLANQLVWSKPQDNARIYPRGFTNQVEVLWSRYNPPAKRNSPILAMSEGVAVWSGGNLSAPVVYPITIHSNNVVTVTNPAASSILFNVGKGTVTGSFWHPDLKKRTAFSGVVLQNQSTVRGYFLGTNCGGLFSIKENH